MHIQTALGQRVRELRKRLGYTQDAFASLIDMDRSYFASVESGKRNVSIVNIEKIAKGLEVTLAELFENIQQECSYDLQPEERENSNPK